MLTGSASGHNCFHALEKSKFTRAHIGSFVMRKCTTVKGLMYQNWHDSMVLGDAAAAIATDAPY